MRNQGHDGSPQVDPEHADTGQTGHQTGHGSLRRRLRRVLGDGLKGLAHGVLADEIDRLIDEREQAAEAVRSAIAYRDEPPWGDLDPGIVDTVRVLWGAGFITTDSGDGRTKLLAGENDGSILPVPHVACRCDPKHLLDETDRAVAVLRAAGYHLHPTEGWHVEGTYDGGSALVMAYGPEPPHVVEGA